MRKTPTPSPRTNSPPSVVPLALQPRVLLPLMIFMAVLTIGLRVDDLWGSLIYNRAFHAISHTEASPAAAKEAKEAKDAKETKADAKEGGKEGAKSGEKAATEPATESSTVPEGPSFRATREADEQAAENEIDPSVLRQLKDRRSQLDQKGQELDAREALIKVAEQRVDQKMKEMESLRTQLQTLVNGANAAQSAQLENLVKIYETMKAKEAAKIFETLDMPTLLGVVEKMKPARIAVIMAEMAPEKAKDITVALTKRDQLPPIK